MLETLPLAAQVAQMIVVRASGYLFDHQIRYPQWEADHSTLQYWLEEVGVGGVILLGGSVAEIRLRCQQLQAWAKVPLLLAADIEEGVGQRFSGGSWFPPPMALGGIYQEDPDLAVSYAMQMGQFTAQEAAAIGLNWLLVPTVDVNNNPDNPVINIRAFGETPEEVSELTGAFIRGCQAYPVLTTAKHFPGHGDTATDSHLELPVILHDGERLAEVELVPFQGAIASGVDTIMTAHLLIPAWDKYHPATLSQPILTGQLRHKLEFDGLIVTDALIMGAITQRYGPDEVAVLAVEAGADVLLMPSDPITAIQAICDAVESERIPYTRIQESVKRIGRAKQKLGQPTPFSFEWKTPVATQEAFTSIEGILANSQTVRGTLRLSPSGGKNMIIVDDSLDCKFLGRHTEAIALPKRYNYQPQIIDSTTPISPQLDDSPTLLQIFVRGNPFRGSAGLTETALTWFQAVLDKGTLEGLIIYGSPYIVDQFVSQLPSEIPYVFTYGQTELAQKIALQALLE